MTWALLTLTPSAHWADRILGLRELSLAGEGVEVQFARGLPAYGWAMVIVAILAFAVWSYVRLTGPALARWALAGVRGLVILLLALLACGPQLVKQNERVERDWVVLLADRSESMQVSDAPGADGAPPRPREAQLQAGLREANPALGALAQRRNVLALGFDAGTFELPVQGDADESWSIGLGEATGKRTALATALSQTLQRVAARPVAGVVLLSDGRSFDAPSRELLMQFAERQIPVYGVALGSAVPLADLAITRVEAPQSAFVGDLVPVTVDVEALGGGVASPARVAGRVQLLDETGAVLQERTLTGEGAALARVTLNAKPEAGGQLAWRVRLLTDEPDLSSDNNAQGVRIELVDRPIRVLYLDGYPRWEYRYVKNLLLREKSIRSTTMLLAAEKRFIQEGSDRIEALPRTSQEWSAFDVVMMGDLRPGLLSEDQLRGLRDAISQRGVGLLWIGGPAFTPSAWRGTALGDLVPFTLAQNSTGAGVEQATYPVLMEPGPAASAYGVLQLADAGVGDGPTSQSSWPDALRDAQLGWSKLQWSQTVDPRSLKPAAEVLALARAVVGDAPAQAATPLVITMRYGAGRSVYVGTDETWRYRYGRGETLTERFWIPLVRLLARGSLGRTGKPALIEASPERALVNQPVRVVVRLLDQSLLDQRPASVRVAIEPDGSGMTASEALGREGLGEELVLAPEATPSSGEGEAGSVATYAGLWVPGRPGLFALSPSEPSLAGLGLVARVQAFVPEDELRRPQTDHAALEQIALATGGRMLGLEELAKLQEILPNREVRLLGTPAIETLWDKPLVLLVLLVLLAAEWVGRRVIKLS